MSWSNIKLILAREIRDQLRDRRTMFMIVVLPVLLYPLLGMSFTQFAQFARQKPTRVLVIGAKNNLPEQPALFENNRFAVRWFAAVEKARLLEVEFATEEPEAAGEGGDAGKERQAGNLSHERQVENLSYEARWAVQEGKYEAALYFPPDFGDRLDAFQDAIRRRAEGADGAAEPKALLAVPKPEIIYTTANEKSQLTYARLSEILRRWTDEIGRSNLAAAGVPESAATPVEPEVIDVADESGFRGAAIWSKILPVLLMLWALTGAFYPAVDLCAGEKERGTLETLLSSPAQRSEIVLGKLVTIMLFSGVTAVLNLASMAVLGWMVLQKLPGFGPPPLLGSVWLLVALAPVSALFSALCLALAAFARSSKEGQYYLMPLLLVTLPLAVLPAASGMELNLGNSLIPVTGIVLVLRAALEGNYWQALQFLPPVVAVTLLGCLAAVRWAVDQFNTESVLFRESERLELGLWVRHLLHDRGPTPTAAAAVFCGVLILLVKFFMSFAMPAPADFAGLAVSAVATQLAVIVTPTLLMTVMLTRSPRQTLLLRWPAWRTIPAAVALAIAFHPVADALRAAVMRLYPINEEMLQALKGLDEAFRTASLWQALLVVALLPAVCEELAFRGFILSGFRRSGSKWRAIIYSAVFFGLSHAILQQSLLASVLGLVLGLVAYQTRSLLPGVLFHLIHNGSAVALARVPREWFSQWPVLGLFASPGEQGGVVFEWPAVVVGALASVALLAWFQKLAPRTPPEETSGPAEAVGVELT